MHVTPLFDARTWTLTYVVWDPVSRDAVVVDPVLDFDPASGRVWTESVDRVLDVIRENGLTLRLVLETHAHADHLSGAHALRVRLGAPVGIGASITAVQAVFSPVFGLACPTDGSQFERLIHDGETLSAGTLSIRAIATPGHTPACTSFVIGDAVFTGDALFVPDAGVGRCDFPGGSADQLYASVHDRLYALPPETRVFVGHDYQPQGRPLQYETTIGASAAHNVHIGASTEREAFVAFRTGRDATLGAPRLLLPSLQVNIESGRLPPADATGVRALRLPLKAPEGL